MREELWVMELEGKVHHGGRFPESQHPSHNPESMN